MRRRMVRHVDAHLQAQQLPTPVYAIAGSAPPLVPPGFSPRDFAVFLLHTGAEIEHVLMVQYLYAAYSLGGAQVPPARREDVRRWQETILGIAKEEMGHLITVQNMLRLLGAPLNLERNDFPWDTPFYPFEFRLERLSRASLARYIVTESPDQWPSDVPEKEEILALAVRGERMAVHQVGKLYEQIIALISDPAMIPDAAFQADTLPLQARSIATLDVSVVCPSSRRGWRMIS